MFLPLMTGNLFREATSLGGLYIEGFHYILKQLKHAHMKYQQADIG